MKFSSGLFQGKLNQCGRRETCHCMGISDPLLLSFLGMATIFCFFVVYSPSPLEYLQNEKLGFESLHAQSNLDVQRPFQPEKGPALIPEKKKNVNGQPRKIVSGQRNMPPKNGGEPLQVKRENAKKRFRKEDRRCDLFKGHWVPESRGSMYTNSSCPTIPDSKNCFRHGRMDDGFLNWRWKPDECELQRFDSNSFMQILRGKTIAFIGDSVARNHMESLLCLLSQVEIPEDLYKDSEDRFRKWYFPKHQLTLTTLWTKFLIAGEERVVDGTGSSIFDLHLDKLDENWASRLPEIDYAIISGGHWFFRVMHLHENEKTTGCVYCNKPNITHYDPSFPFRMAFRAALRHINNCENCSGLVTILRTFSPAHFEKGGWDSGGHCSRTSPMAEEEIDLEKSFDWGLRNIQVEEIEKARREGEKKGRRFAVVDVTRAMKMRADGHPNEFWGNKWMKGFNDCVHWCMPGPIDVWNDFLMEVVVRENPNNQ